MYLPGLGLLIGLLTLFIVGAIMIILVGLLILFIPAALFALLPYKVQGLKVTPKAETVQPGDAVRYDVGLLVDGGQPGLHVFSVEILGPDGQPRRHYDAKLLARAGAASGEFRTALNDAPGEWTIRATDIATKTVGTTTVRFVP